MIYNCLESVMPISAWMIVAAAAIAICLGGTGIGLIWFGFRPAEDRFEVKQKAHAWMILPIIMLFINGFLFVVVRWFTHN